MDNLKQKIDAEISEPKWNDTLSEAIHAKAAKKSFSRYHFATICTVMLACFLIVLNLQPTPMPPMTGNEDIQAATITEMYVVDADYEEGSFNAVQSRWHFPVDLIDDVGTLQEMNAILLMMQPLNVWKPSYFSYTFQKDVILVDSNEQSWRMKLYIFDPTVAYLYNIDTGQGYEFLNDQLNPVNPLNNLYIFFAEQSTISMQVVIGLLAMFILVGIVHVYFSKVHHIKYSEKPFKENNKNIFMNLYISITIFLLLNTVGQGWITFIPTLLLLFALCISIYLWIVYRSQSRLYFRRECISMGILFVFLIYVMFIL